MFQSTFVALLFLSLGVSATHFRFHVTNWKRDSSNPATVHFSIQQAWRHTYFNSPPVGNNITVATFSFGDGATSVPRLTVEVVDTDENWLFGRMMFSHTYPNPNLNYTAGFSSRARISTLKDGNNDNDYVLRAIIPAGASEGPILTSVPIKDMTKGIPNSYFIPALAARGGTLSFAIAPTTGPLGSGLTTASPSGLTLNTVTGEIVWNPSTLGLYAIQIRVTETANGISASSPVDFILRVVETSTVDPAPLLGVPSLCAAPCTAYSITATRGSTISFTVQGTDTVDSNDNRVRIEALNVAGTISPCSEGSTSSQGFSDTEGSCTRTVTWTVPSTASSQDWLFTAIDAAGQRSQTLTLSVMVAAAVSNDDCSTCTVTEHASTTDDYSTEAKSSGKAAKLCFN